MTDNEMRELAERYSKYCTQSADQCYTAIVELQATGDDLSGIVKKVESWEREYGKFNDFGNVPGWAL